MRFSSIIVTVVGILFLAPALSLANTPSDPTTSLTSGKLVKLPTLPHRGESEHSRKTSVFPNERSKQLKGWDYLYGRLLQEGLQPEHLQDLFSDPRMPKRKPVYFRAKPRETKSLYRKHNTRRARRHALRFYKKHWRYFKRASIEYEIPESILLAVLQIETKCGSYTGRSRVFHRLARLASVGDPNNIEENFRSQSRKDKTITRQALRERAQWLEETFLPHLAATIVVAQGKDVHPLELRGSPAGAFGLPQFLPGNILLFGIDADRNGTVDLFSVGDAIFSMANFLRQHGWVKLDLPEVKQHEVIFHYNHSTSYVETVLEMARMLDKEISSFNHFVPDQILELTVSPILPARYSPEKGH